MSAKTLALFAVVLLFSAGSAFAHEGAGIAPHEEPAASAAALQFPQWTYWVEIFEHAAITVVAAAAVAYLLLMRKKSSIGTKRAGLLATGFALLALSQLLTNLHHFLIYPFGELNAIAHHGLLLASVIVIAIGVLGAKPNGT